MKPDSRFVWSICRCTLGAMVLIALLLFIPVRALVAQTIPGKAEVRATQGLVSYSDDDGTGMPLKAGTILHPGTLIETESSGAADILFDGGAGLVRLSGKGTFRIDKLTMQRTREGDIVDIQLTLSQGLLLGKTEKLLPGSHFEVTTAAGIASVHRGVFRLDATGKLEVADGSVAFAQAPPGAAPVLHTVSAPPVSVLVPGQGIQPGSESLRREIEAQVAAKLKKR